MRAEDKQLESQDLEREQRAESSRHEEHLDELPSFAGNEVRDVDLDHRSRLFDGLQLILAGEQVNVTLLYLPQREAHALEALQTAVDGRDSMGEFVYAEDRQGLLEQALAVLQQNLTHGEPAQLAELQSKFATLTGQVAELREVLDDLEDAQEEREEFHQAAKPGAAGETDAKPKPKPGKPEDARLDGPERAEPASGPSTLFEPDRPVEPRPASTLTGPDRPEPAARPSTLDGPDRPVPARGPSTVGDPQEMAEAAAKLPWWKRRG